MCCKENSTFHLLQSLVSLFITITQISAIDVPINVWPKPTTFQWPHPASILLSPSFTISHPHHQHLSPAVSRYHHQILTEHHRPLVPPTINLSSSPPLSALIITISDLTSPLIHGVNESYTLTIPPPLGSNTAPLTAQTPRRATRVDKSYSLNIVSSNINRSSNSIPVHHLTRVTIPGPLNSTSGYLTPQTPRGATHVKKSYTLNISSSVVNGQSNLVPTRYSTEVTNPQPPNSTTAYLTAQTPWGAMRGLETFSQLIYGNPPRVAAGVYISDEPIFQHRGVLLDTSRNYYGVEDLLRLIKAMSMNKLNVFHWHITDSHSFPLVLPSEPELAGRGSYGEDMKYTIEDVKKIVNFGFEHGVRVVPEIDMPGE